MKIIKTNKYMYLNTNINLTDPTIWFEFRICGIGIDFSYYTKKDTLYCDKRRLEETWCSYKDLPLKAKIEKWLWVNCSWFMSFHFYKFNQFNMWYDDYKSQIEYERNCK